jgi:hypothetical protein
VRATNILVNDYGLLNFITAQEFKDLQLDLRIRFYLARNESTQDRLRRGMQKYSHYDLGRLLVVRTVVGDGTKWKLGIRFIETGVIVGRGTVAKLLDFGLPQIEIQIGWLRMNYSATMAQRISYYKRYSASRSEITGLIPSADPFGSRNQTTRSERRLELCRSGNPRS